MSNAQTIMVTCGLCLLQQQARQRLAQLTPLLLLLAQQLPMLLLLVLPAVQQAKSPLAQQWQQQRAFQTACSASAMALCTL